MNKIQFDKLLKPLIVLYDEIELDLVMNILERIDNYSKIKGSLEWYLDKLSEIKLFDKDNLKVLKNNKRKIKQILMDIADYSGGSIDNLEQLKGYYQKGLISIDPITLYDSIAIQSLVREAFEDSQDIMELINTKALEGAKESYKKVLNKAYLETASGTYSYTESIRKAMNEMAQQGIKTVNYESGVQLSIEAVVRRDVVTRMNKLVGDCEIEHAKQLDTNLVYVDQHLGARVRTKYMKHDYEAHAEWQGKKYMIDGSSEEYPNLYEATGYGEMLGLKGINCYHNMRPTWEWETIPNVIDEVENAIQYEKLQRQRALERKSRALKREKEVAKHFDDEEEIKKINNKLKKHNEEYDSWLEENGLTRDYNREYIVSSKTDKKQTSKEEQSILHKDVTQEWLDSTTPNSHEIKDMDYFEHNGIKYEVDGKNVVLDYSKHEKEVAEWLENTFGGEIYMVPRINNPSGIQTSDYIFRKENWDLKSINGKSKQALYHAIRKKGQQSNNFIFEILNDELTLDEIRQQVQSLYRRTDIPFLKKVIIKKSNDFSVFERK